MNSLIDNSFLLRILSSEQKALSPQAVSMLQNLKQDATLLGVIQRTSQNMVTVKTDLGLLSLKANAHDPTLPKNAEVALKILQPYPNLKVALTLPKVASLLPGSSTTFVAQNQFSAQFSTFDIKPLLTHVQNTKNLNNLESFLKNFPQLSDSLKEQILTVRLSNPQSLQGSLDNIIETLAKVNLQQKGPNLSVPGLVLGSDQMGQTIIKSIFGLIHLMKEGGTPPPNQTLVTLEILIGLLKGKPIQTPSAGLPFQILAGTPDPQASLTAMQVYYSKFIQKQANKRFFVQNTEFGSRTKTDIFVKFYQISAYLQTGNEHFIFDEKFKNQFGRDAKFIEHYKQLLLDIRKKYLSSLDKEWKSFYMPYFTDEGLEKIDIYVKNIRDDSGQHIKRFIFETNFAKLGNIQIDGFYNSEKLFLKIHTTSEIPQYDQDTLIKMFQKYIKALSLYGKLSFAVDENFSAPYLSE